MVAVLLSSLIDGASARRSTRSGGNSNSDSNTSKGKRVASPSSRRSSDPNKVNDDVTTSYMYKSSDVLKSIT